MRFLTAMILLCLTGFLDKAACEDIDLGAVTEQHQMIPMRDGQHLSAWLYFPEGDGPWPVLATSEPVSSEDDITAWVKGVITQWEEKNLKVKAGDRIVRGDPIAQVGSSGQVTGPHVHYEVLKDGRAVNPADFRLSDVIVE